MVESLKNTYYRLINEMNITTFRNLYETFTIDNRLTGLVGPRGTGKTTLLLQYIRDKIDDKHSAVYVSADHIYFNKKSLFDFTQELFETEGRRLFFFDEVHKYSNWNQELKNIYDSFPSIKIVFSGSSSIDLLKGTYDLSRRCVVYHLNGLSFREYINFSTNNNYGKYTFEEIIKNHMDITEQLAKIPKLKGYFNDYVESGYYPFVFEGTQLFNRKLLSIINKTVFEDIASNFNINTANLQYFKKLLYFLATIPPGEMNINNLSRSLGVDNKTIQHYTDILVRTGLSFKIAVNKRGGALIRNPQKLYLENSTLYHTICKEIGHDINRGAIREICFLQFLKNAGLPVFYSKECGDFECEGIYFEIGGKNKTRKQLKKMNENAFIVKDDMLIGGGNTMPLYLFGFLY
jgi:predicted AAA+ superfamily ATPase